MLCAVAGHDRACLPTALGDNAFSRPALDLAMRFAMRSATQLRIAPRTAPVPGGYAEVSRGISDGRLNALNPTPIVISASARVHAFGRIRLFPDLLDNRPEAIF